MALNTTQPANQAPTGNLFMGSNGKSYANQASADVSVGGTGKSAGNVGYNASTGLYGTNPTTLSSGNAAAQIPNIQAKQTALTDGSGITTDPNTGIATYANKTVVQPPKAANDPSNMYNTETGQLNTNYTNYTGYKPPATDGTTSTGGYFNQNGSMIYIAPGGVAPKDANGNPIQLTATDPTNDAISQKVLDIMARSDANGVAQLQNIQDSYANLVKQQEEANKSAAAGTTAYLVGAGRGVGSSDAVLQGTISYGLQQITNLQTEKNANIIKAQQAIDDNDFKYASFLQDRADKKTALQQTEYDKVQDHILQAAKDLAAQKQKDTDSINAVSEEAAKSGAPADVIKAINASKSPAEAIAAYAPYAQDPTSPAGQYNAYVKQTQAKGLTPLSAGDFLAKQKSKEAYNNAYSAEAGKAAADAKYGTSNKAQQGMEKDFKNTLLKEFSSRSGTYGLNDAKVSQANKLATLFDQAYDPKTGNYNLASSQYGELAAGLASLISNSPGGGSDADIANLKIATAKGDWNKVYTYITGSPSNASTQDVFKLLAQSVDREAKQAAADRQVDEDKLIGLAPTDLDPARRDALIKAQSIQYKGIQGISDPQTQVENFVSSDTAKTPIDPAINTKISSMTGGKIFKTAGELGIYMSGLPGSDPQSVLNALKGLGLVK